MKAATYDDLDLRAHPEFRRRDDTVCDISSKIEAVDAELEQVRAALFDLGDPNECGGDVRELQASIASIKKQVSITTADRHDALQFVQGHRTRPGITDAAVIKLNDKRDEAAVKRCDVALSELNRDLRCREDALADLLAKLEHANQTPTDAADLDRLKRKDPESDLLTIAALRHRRDVALPEAKRELRSQLDEAVTDRDEFKAAAQELVQERAAEILRRLKKQLADVDKKIDAVTAPLIEERDIVAETIGTIEQRVRLLCGWRGLSKVYA